MNNNNNVVSRNSNKFINKIKKRVGKSGLGLVIGVIVLVMILGLIYYFYNASSISYSNNNPLWVDKPINASTSMVRPKKVPNAANAYSFSYSLWIYVSDWNYKFGEDKTIFVRKNSLGVGPDSLSLGLYPKTNTLNARINTDKGPQTCDIKDIPLQKWVHIGYVVNNRNVDVYIDGKLERSCVLKGLPLMYRQDKVYIADNGGFYGQIGKFQFFSKSLTPTDIQNLYTSGPFDAKLFDINLFNRGQLITVDS